MQRMILAATLCLVAFCAKAQSFETLKDRDGSKMLTGFISDSILKNDTAFSWFTKPYEIYHPKEQVVKDIVAGKDSVNLVIFMGTWCEDSHFVIPRFFKILDSAGFDKSRISMKAVDRTKKDKHHLAAALNIINVPTIIVYKNGKEAGRVVEYGETGRYDEETARLFK